MEKITFDEQVLINAICLHVASKKQIQPQEVEVELMWDEEYGFSAEVYTMGRKQVFIEINLIEAIRFYLETQLQRNPYSAGIELVLDDEEGILAYVTYQS
ncbi:YxcD family protein [Brevibacillus choshinensis]|uniref:YxcD family protein n=1 Tax=Brevibacillus choshinensis TaxID=54911 RepID=A0ABX7FQL0_BRECH|nr:YxcD family protein [Brevibacillus choshinensis]QRG67582.1 YxcD family protein [Brevibacillus choshinensis]